MAPNEERFTINGITFIRSWNSTQAGRSFSSYSEAEAYAYSKPITIDNLPPKLIKERNKAIPPRQKDLQY